MNDITSCSAAQCSGLMVPKEERQYIIICHVLFVNTCSFAQKYWQIQLACQPGASLAVPVNLRVSRFNKSMLLYDCNFV